MHAAPAPSRRLLLLGRDFRRYGEATCVALEGGRTAAAISAGAREHTPARFGKGDPVGANEDALFAQDDGRRVVLAVADAHFGIEASHALMLAVRAAVEDPPRDEAALLALLPRLADPRADPRSASATTLLLAAFDREAGRGAGLSVGDSSFHVLGPEGVTSPTEKTRSYLHPASAETFAASQARTFAFEAAPGRLLVAFTDGVDECQYGSPATSVGPRHLAALFATTGPDAEAFARTLVETALQGVDGHPGGEDNVAIVVAAT